MQKIDSSKTLSTVTSKSPDQNSLLELVDLHALELLSVSSCYKTLICRSSVKKCLARGVLALEPVTHNCYDEPILLSSHTPS